MQKKIRNILISIFLLGLVLRILNPTFGSPILYVSGDEAPNYITALLMMEKINPFIDTAVYPPFGTYIQIPFLALAFLGMLVLGKVHTLTELKLLVVTQEGFFLFVPRLISGFLGALTIFLVYKITNLTFSKRISLVTTLLFAFSFNHIQMSHSGRPWVPALFFFALSLYYSLKSLTYVIKQKRNVILSNIFAVISFGFHQIGIIAVWFFFLSQTMGKKRSIVYLYKDKVTRLGLMISLSGIGILNLINRLGPSTGWFRNSTDFPPGYPLAAIVYDIIFRNNLIYHIREFLFLEPVIFIFFVVSLFYQSNWKYPRNLLLLFTLSTFIVIGLSFPQPRYMLPVLLIMSIFASEAIDKLLTSIRYKTLKIIFLLLIFGAICVQPLLWNRIYFHEPTFIQAQNWINQHIPPEDVILTTATKFTGFTPAKEVIDLQQKIEPGFYGAAESFLEPGEYPPNVRNIIYLNKVEFINDRQRIPKLLKDFPLPYKYIIDIFWDPKETTLIQVDKKQFEKIISFSPLFPNKPKVKIDNILATVYEPEFPELLLMLERAGPYIDVYKVK